MTKTALIVMYNKSPQNLYEALVNKKIDVDDKVKSVTENDLKKMTKI